MERKEKTLNIEQFSNYTARILSSVDIRTFEVLDAKASSNHVGNYSALGCRTKSHLLYYFEFHKFMRLK